MTNLQHRIFTAFIGIIASAILYYLQIPYLVPTTLSFMSLWMLVIELPGLISIKSAWFWVAAIWYIIIPFYCAFELYLGGVSTRYLLVITFAVTAIHDAASYFVGKTMGKHFLAPTLSPKKTWEGVGGGFLAIALLFYGASHKHIPITLVILIALITSVLCVTGDLFESWLKRKAHVKDAGTLLPGHGGLLDRFDSFLFLVPVVYFFQNPLVAIFKNFYFQNF